MGSYSFKHSKKSENPFPSLVCWVSAVSSSTASSLRMMLVTQHFIFLNGLRSRQERLPPLGQESNQIGRLCGLKLLSLLYLRGIKKTCLSTLPTSVHVLVNQYIPTFRNCLLSFYSTQGNMLSTALREITKPDMIPLWSSARKILTLRFYCFNLHRQIHGMCAISILTHSRHH